jgi:tetratricopeptide (TPR) repeat protein
MKPRQLLPLVVLLLLCVTTADAQAQSELPRGRVVEQVTCQADATQSYALYLPTSYTPARKFPILYAFDPGARGARPVELFKDAAERYGYIVVGSNNSRNGMDVTAAVNTLWDDTHARFTIDERRVYAAGFSGGARVATGLGQVSNGAIAGVIACGGGFSGGSKPTQATPFILFATTGTEDFNHPELNELHRTFDALGLANRLAVFAGGHDWPPRELCMEAIEWLEMQAMRAGRRVRDDALIEQLFKQRVEQAHAAEGAQKLYDAYNAYDTLVREFKDLRDVTEFERKLRELAKTKEVKDALKREREEDERQMELAAALDARAPAPESAATYEATQLHFSDRAAQLRRQAQSATDTSERRVARRVLGQFTVSYFEQAAALRRQKRYAEAASQLELLVELRPDNARALYELAAAYALAGQKQKALKTLKRAVDAGFANAALIEQNEDFNTLRVEVEFQQLVAGLKKNAKPPPQ